MNFGKDTILKPIFGYTPLFILSLNTSYLRAFHFTLATHLCYYYKKQNKADFSRIRIVFFTSKHYLCKLEQ